jgi:hypothetical protein
MKLTLDPEIYTLTAIENMVEQFAAYMNVDVQIENGLSLTMTVTEPHQADRTVIIHSFLNNILELSIQEQLNDEC